MTVAESTLVTGAYGLIGHAVVTALHARGLPVVATDRLTSPPADAAISAVPLSVGGVEALAEFIVARGIATIVHAAGISGPMLARDRPHLVFSVNVAGTLDLFEAARLTGVKRIVLLSSASVYGRTSDELITEAAPLHASRVYAVSKIAGEHVARAYAANHGVETVILRPSWVYGPRRRTPCVIRTMIEDALLGRATRLPYGKGFPRQFIHVDDVVGAVLAALSISRVSGLATAINLTGGTRRNLDEVAGIVRTILPRADIELDAGDDPDDDFVGPLDLSAANQHLGWRPTISLDAGVRSYAAYLSGSGLIG